MKLFKSNIQWVVSDERKKIHKESIITTCIKKIFLFFKTVLWMNWHNVTVEVFIWKRKHCLWGKKMTDSNHIFQNYHLTTVEITYYLPDHPSVLQTFLWQAYDQAPTFPRLKNFLDYWSHSIDGKLHSISLAHLQRIDSRGARHVDYLDTLH